MMIKRRKITGPISLWIFWRTIDGGAGGRVQCSRNFSLFLAIPIAKEGLSRARMSSQIRELTLGEGGPGPACRPRYECQCWYAGSLKGPDIILPPHGKHLPLSTPPPPFPHLTFFPSSILPPLPSSTISTFPSSRLHFLRPDPPFQLFLLLEISSHPPLLLPRIFLLIPPSSLPSVF
jgi:hypothetical protein